MREADLDRVGDIRLGFHQEFSWNPHDSFVRSAPGTRRQFIGERRNVGANDGKVTVRHFPEIGTTVGVQAEVYRVSGNKATYEHGGISQLGTTSSRRNSSSDKEWQSVRKGI